MRRYLVLAVGLVSLSVVAMTAQTPIVTGDRSTPLRPLAGADNVGVRACQTITDFCVLGAAGWIV